MMMLPSLLDIAALSLGSPSKTGKVRVNATRFRYDPYRPKVCALQQKKTFAAVAPCGGAAHVACQRPCVASFAPHLFNLAMAPTRAPSPAEAAQSASLGSYPSTDTMISIAPAALPPLVSPLGMPMQQQKVSPVASDPVVAPPTPSKLVYSSEVKGTRYAVIGFKHEAATYQAPFRVAVGDVVIVEADRGEHVGVVQSLSLEKPEFNVPSKILRHASKKEITAVDELTEKEKRVTAKVQRSAEACGLGIRVLDTEFQLDGNKLTVFFASKAFVDFRKLQRTLFREFRTRIWLVNWDEVKLYTPVPVNFV